MATAAKDIVVEAQLASAEPKDIVLWVQALIENIVFQLNNGIPKLRFAQQDGAPLKPRDGNVAFADGTNWNPGSGKGFYGYYSGAWHFLG